jgi:hypothetical protein
MGGHTTFKETNGMVNEETPALAEEQAQADMLTFWKIAHDNHATVVHLLKTRVQFFHEEFLSIHNLVNFYSQLRDDLRVKIEQAEPPVAPEPKKPYVIDAGQVKAPEASL